MQFTESDIQRMLELICRGIQTVEVTVKGKNYFHQLDYISNVLNERNAAEYSAIEPTLDDAVRVLYENGIYEERIDQDTKAIYKILNRNQGME